MDHRRGVHARARRRVVNAKLTGLGRVRFVNGRHVREYRVVVVIIVGPALANQHDDGDDATHDEKAAQNDENPHHRAQPTGIVFLHGFGDRRFGFFGGFLLGLLRLHANVQGQHLPGLGHRLLGLFDEAVLGEGHIDRTGGDGLVDGVHPCRIGGGVKGLAFRVLCHHLHAFDRFLVEVDDGAGDARCVLVGALDGHPAGAAAGVTSGNGDRQAPGGGLPLGEITVGAWRDGDGEVFLSSRWQLAATDRGALNGVTSTLVDREGGVLFDTGERDGRLDRVGGFSAVGVGEGDGDRGVRLADFGGGLARADRDLNVDRIGVRGDGCQWGHDQCESGQYGGDPGNSGSPHATSSCTLHCSLLLGTWRLRHVVVHRNGHYAPDPQPAASDGGVPFPFVCQSLFV